MTTKADFTEEEWATLVRSPVVAGMAITFADPGGPIEVLKETSAVVKFVTSSSSEQRDDLTGELAREVRGLAEQRKNPVGDFKRQRDRQREGEPRGGRGIPRVDHGVRAERRRRCEGGWVHGLQRRAREPRREGYARATPLGVGNERRLSEARALARRPTSRYLRVGRVDTPRQEDRCKPARG